MAVKRAKEAFAVVADGVPRVVRAGDLLDDRDPVVKAHKHLFEDVAANNKPYETRESEPTEQATAKPGEKRSAPRPSTKTVSKTDEK